VSVTNYSRNLGQVRARIEKASEQCGRDPATICLIAVSKTHPADSVRALYDLGHRHFGENRLQEALPKIEGLPNDIVWHFIGHLQSNKTKRVAQYFSVVHTLSTRSQIQALTDQPNEIDGLIEINSAREPQKSGILIENLASFREIVLQCKRIHLRGLMTVGPVVANQEEIRPYFREVAAANRDEWLSLGMSDSLEVGIQEGATHVRIGTSLFGERG